MHVINKPPSFSPLSGGTFFELDNLMLCCLFDCFPTFLTSFLGYVTFLLSWVNSSYTNSDAVWMCLTMRSVRGSLLNSQPEITQTASWISFLIHAVQNEIIRNMHLITSCLSFIFAIVILVDQILNCFYIPVANNVNRFNVCGVETWVNLTTYWFTHPLTKLLKWCSFVLVTINSENSSFTDIFSICLFLAEVKAETSSSYCDGFWEEAPIVASLPSTLLLFNPQVPLHH